MVGDKVYIVRNGCLFRVRNQIPGAIEECLSSVDDKNSDFYGFDFSKVHFVGRKERNELRDICDDELNSWKRK